VKSKGNISKIGNDKPEEDRLMYKNGVRNYRQTEVMTADPKRLVIMCYQGVIDNLKIAVKRHAEQQFEAKAKAIGKAEDFLNELMHSLDFERGGEIAKNLDSLYNYMIRRIIFAEANRTTAPLNEILGLMEELKDAWETIFFGSKKDMLDTSSPVPYLTEKSGAAGIANCNLRVR
jgi:flagellar protein FliS